MSGRRPRPRWVRAVAGGIAGVALIASAAAAQPAGAAALEISVLTMGQGDQVWERFGHNALRIRDAERGTDIAYNWGLFDFAEPGFLVRFLTGDTRYWMAGFDAGETIAYYQQLGRTVTEQRLALTPEQARALRDFVEWNARPENRFYRYDYYLDNCSTRLRDALDRALGGAVRRSLVPMRSRASYRSETVRLLDGMPVTQAGVMLALGRPADRALTEWELGFVPMRLRDALRRVQLPGPDGTPVPLVAEERVVVTAARAPEPDRAPGLVVRFAVIGAALAALLVLAGWRAARGGRMARAALAVAGGAWGFAAGVAGTILSAAWLATRHRFWYDNENLLLFPPLALALVVLAPLAVYRPGARRPAVLVAGVVALLAVLDLLLKLLPGTAQQNAPLVALALPVHLALLWSLVTVDGGVPWRPRRGSMPAERANAARGAAT